MPLPPSISCAPEMSEICCFLILNIIRPSKSVLQIKLKLRKFRVKNYVMQNPRKSVPVWLMYCDVWFFANSKNLGANYCNCLNHIYLQIFLTLVSFPKISDTNQINQYLDIKNYILKIEWRHVSLYTNNIFWSIS